VLFGGWFVEWMGVQTSAVFGSYQYLDTLGWKVAGVPVIIGVNWLLLIYSIGSYLDQWKAHLLLKILVGALLMVLVDIFIEPVAIALDFWVWDQGVVPIKNYLGWFIVSLIFFTVFFKLGFKKKNKLGLFVYILQLVFFIIMWLTI
jgi:putative membrane protein